MDVIKITEVTPSDFEAFVFSKKGTRIPGKRPLLLHYVKEKNVCVGWRKSINRTLTFRRKHMLNKMSRTCFFFIPSK